MTSSAHEFESAARAFCAWAETNEPADSFAEAFEARKLLARLVSVAADLELPEDPGPEVNAESLDSTSEEYQLVLRRFGALPFNYYSEMFNPLEVPPSEEPVIADLADDLADVWRDIKRGLKLWDEGQISAALWNWAFHFSAHWGHHATAALYALQTWFSRIGDDRRWGGA